MGASPKAGSKWLLVVASFQRQEGQGFPFYLALLAGRVDRMFLATDTGMVNVFIEPQFAEVSSQTLLTVQCSDLATFQLLKLNDDDSFWMNLKDDYFPFVGYGYRWSLGHKIAGFKKLADVEVLTEDFSPPVKGFKWMGLYLPNPDYDPEEGDDDESELHSGYCLPDEVDSARFGSDVAYESFHVYPMFRLPTNEQLNTIWCS